MRLQGVQEVLKEESEQNRMLNDLAWQDVKEYQQHLRDEARKSLSFRLAEAKRHHMIDLEQHRQKLDQLHEELLLKRQDWQDINAYREQERESRRKSVGLRLQSWRIQKLAEEKLEAKKRLILEEEARYREMDWEDLNEAKNILKQEELENLRKGKMVF